MQEKPYRELEDSAGRADEEVAEEQWDYHRSRNDSFIVDALHGQYRSQITCPDCGRCSTTFDPFSSVSLPLATGAGLPPEQPLTVLGCLDALCTPEVLTEDNMWYCSSCQDHRYGSM